jgi:hypothetical protein
MGSGGFVAMSGRPGVRGPGTPPRGLRYTPTVSSSGPLGPVPPPAEFATPATGPGGPPRHRAAGRLGRPGRPATGPPATGPLAAGTSSAGIASAGIASAGAQYARRAAASQRDRDSLGEPEPSPLKRFATHVFAAMRERNWVTGLAIPIFAAIAVGVAVVIVAGANSGSGPAPSSLSAGFPPARDAATDFTGTAALAGRGVSQPLGQVAVFGTTAVAVGSQTGTRVARPRFFFSTDNGKSWQLAAVRGTPTPGRAATLVAGGAHGWLAVGQTSSFVSPNGQSWRPAAPLPQVGGDAITAVTATASGFVAVGQNVPGGNAAQASPVVWVSANGTTWRRATGTQLGLTTGAGRVLGITSVVASGNVVVLTAGVAGGGSAAWRSADGGTTWASVTIPAGDTDSATIAGLAALGTGFVAVRADPASGSADVFTSANGVTWQQSATLATANGAPLTVGPVSGGPAGAVVAGQADGLEIAFISANGTTWTGTDPVNTATAERVSSAALAADGSAVVAGTSVGDAAEEQPMLTVIGAQGGPDQINMRAVPGATIPEIAVNAITGSAATEVAAGSADGFPALWTSAAGGAAWTQATGATPTALDRPGEEQLTGVAHGSAGWLAVGGPIAGSGTGSPVVVTSADGSTWTAVDGETPFTGAGVVTSAAAAGTSGYVIVGSQVSGGHTAAAAWYSASLTGWQRADDAQGGALDGSGNRQLNAVVATAKGFAAVGSVAAHPAAWLSDSGQTWSESTLPLPVGASSATLRYVAANGNTVAAVGTETTGAGNQLPFAAVSANGGATWTETALPMPTRHTSTGQAAGTVGPVTALAAAGGGFTATGTYGLSGSQDVVVWTLVRGAAPDTTWMVATPQGTGLAGQGTQAITALTGAGDTLTGVGFAATATSEEPTIWQTPARS